MNVLVLSPQPFFSPRGTPFSVYYRTLILAENDVHIDLLTYGEGQDVDIPGVRIIRIPRFKMLGNVKIGPSFLKLFLDVFMLVWAVALLAARRYDVVHAHEEAVFFCRFLKPIFGFKLIYDMHSSLPQQLANFQFTQSKIITSIFKMLEDSCLHAADAVITICPDLADYTNQIIKDRDKHLLIENSIFEPVRLASGSAAPLDEAALPAVPEGKRCIVYAGTLEPYQGIGILVESFESVIAEVPDAFLVIVGGTQAQVDTYAGMAEKLGIREHTLFTGRISQAAARHYVGQASVLVSPRIKGTNTPLKIYEQIASGIPLVATRIYSHTQVLTDAVCILVDPEHQDMAHGIISALSPDGTGERVADNASRLYAEHYSRPVYVGKIKRLLRILS